MLNEKKQPLGYVPLFLSVLAFVIFRHFFFAQTGDDSYIYFRYVERALAGNWWGWSDHIPPVEGYSSQLWYGLLVVSAKLGAPVILASRLWGLLFSFITLLGAWYLSRELKASVLASGMACLLLAINQGFNYWATSGLETSLYAALLVWSCIGIIRERFWFLPTALIGIARPEGAFLLVAILVAMFIFKRGKFSVAALLFCLFPTLIGMLVRLHVYGEWLPNTFYAKATGEFQDQFFKGLLYCLPVLSALFIGWIFWLQERNQAVMVTLGITTMLCAIILLGGGDWMFHFRLLVPLLALVFAVAASQWEAVVLWKKCVLVIFFIPLLLLSVPVRYVMPILQGQMLPEKDYQEGSMTQQSIALAGLIAKRYPAPQLLAVNHAGALPWALPAYNVIDMVGLNDAHIARAKGRLHHKYDVEYVLGQKPDLIILNSRVKPGTDGVWYHKGYWPGEDALVSHPDFSCCYEATDLLAEWHWHVPFPYTLIVKNADTSWIIVYQRKH